MEAKITVKILFIYQSLSVDFILKRGTSTNQTRLGKDREESNPGPCCCEARVQTTQPPFEANIIKM